MGATRRLVDVMARDLRAEFGLRVFSLFGSGGAAFTGLGEQERTYGFHAGEVETSFLLSAIPELVHTNEYTVNYIADIDKPELLRPENSPANFAWLTRDIAPSGVMGDPNPGHGREGNALDRRGSYKNRGCPDRHGRLRELAQTLIAALRESQRK